MTRKHVLALGAALALVGCLAAATNAMTPASSQANMISTQLQNGTMQYEIGLNDPPATMDLKVGDQLKVTVTFGVAPQPMLPHPKSKTTDGQSSDTLTADYVPQPIGTGQSVQVARFTADRAGTADIIWTTYEGDVRAVTKITVKAR